MIKSLKLKLKPIGRFFGKVFRTITPLQVTMKAIAPTVLSFVFLAVFLVMMDDSYELRSSWMLVVFILFFLLMGLALALLIAALIRLFSKIPKKFLVTLIFALFCIMGMMQLPKYFAWTFFVGAVILPSIIIAGVYKWRQGAMFPLKGAKRIFSFSLTIVSIAAFVIFLVLYFSPGSLNTPIKNVDLGAKMPDTIDAPDPSKPGMYTIGTLTYGSGNDKHRDEFGKKVTIKTPTVDASRMLKSWKGVSGKMRTAFFGFDASELPLNATVWYPKNQDSLAPLVLIVHGNHLAIDYSDPGYAYLGEMLASRGYIVASVDENFVNSTITDLPMFGGGLKEENGVRGWLLLKHLENWRKWSQDSSSAFYRKVDMDRIAIIGHSRGGEAVSHAALFNRLPCLPDNAKEVFNFNFNIRAAIAIASVDGQYKPADILAPIRDLNYFVIHGSHDMDMASYAGLATYKRIQYSPGNDGFKAGLYVGFANHGQFNTSWGRRDGSSPYINRYNLKQLISATDQQQIAKTYIGAFLDINLMNKTVYKPLFMDYRFGRKWLPAKLYFNQYEPAEKLVLTNYDEDLDLGSTTIAGGKIETEGIQLWKERSFKTEWGGLLTRAAYIGWKKEKDSITQPSYSVTLPDSLPAQISDRMLVFSLTEGSDKPEDDIKPKTGRATPATADSKASEVPKKSLKERDDSGNKNGNVKKNSKDQKDAKDKTGVKGKTDKTEKKDESPINFSIELTDSKGEKIRFLLSECGLLQSPIKKMMTKFSFLNEAAESEAIPDFFYFDLKKLGTMNPAFTAQNLKKIKFVFDQKKEGTIILDDLWLMRNQQEQLVK